MYGPLPAELAKKHFSAVSSVAASAPSWAPCACATVELMMPVYDALVSLINSELDWLNVATTVSGSGVSMLLIACIRYEPDPWRFFKRSQENCTSLACTGEPSENFALGSRWKV